MPTAGCHLRLDTFDSGLSPSPPVLLVTRIFKQLPEAQTWHEHCVSAVERFIREILNRRLPMLNKRVLTSVVVALAATITTQSFAQDRGTGATPAGAKAGAIQGTFTTSDAIPWKPVDPKHPGLMMFVVGGTPNCGPRWTAGNEGASEIVQKFAAVMDSGRHWHTAAYEGVAVQGKFTPTFKGPAPRTGGPGSNWSQPARQGHDGKCRKGADGLVGV